MCVTKLDNISKFVTLFYISQSLYCVFVKKKKKEKDEKETTIAVIYLALPSTPDLNDTFFVVLEIYCLFAGTLKRKQ